MGKAEEKLRAEYYKLRNGGVRIDGKVIGPERARARLEWRSPATQLNSQYTQTPPSWQAPISSMHNPYAPAPLIGQTMTIQMHYACPPMPYHGQAPIFSMNNSYYPAPPIWPTVAPQLNYAYPQMPYTGQLPTPPVHYPSNHSPPASPSPKLTPSFAFEQGSNASSAVQSFSTYASCSPIDKSPTALSNNAAPARAQVHKTHPSSKTVQQDAATQNSGTNSTSQTAPSNSKPQVSKEIRRIPGHDIFKKDWTQISDRKLNKVQASNAKILGYRPQAAVTPSGQPKASPVAAAKESRSDAMPIASLSMNVIDSSHVSHSLFADDHTSVDRVISSDTNGLETSSSETSASGIPPAILTENDASTRDNVESSKTTEFLLNMVRRVKISAGFSVIWLHGVEVCKETLEHFLPRAWYSAQTFHLLRATIDIPTDCIIMTEDERLKLTSSTQDVLIICNVNRVHWIVIHASLPNNSLVYYDSMRTDEDQPDMTTCCLVFEKLKRAMQDRGGLRDTWKPSVPRMHRTIVQTDTYNCGPLAWREIEEIIGRLTPVESVDKVRYRQAKQVIDFITRDDKYRSSYESSQELPSPSEILKDDYWQDQNSFEVASVGGNIGHGSTKDKSHRHHAGKGLEDGSPKDEKHRRPAGTSSDSLATKKRKNSITANEPEEHYPSHDNLTSDSEELTADSQPRPHTKRNSRSAGARRRYIKQDTNYIWAQANLGTPWNEIAKTLGRKSCNVARKYDQLYRNGMNSAGKKTTTKGPDRSDSDRAETGADELMTMRTAPSKRKRDPSVSYNMSYHILDEVLGPDDPPASDSSDYSNYFDYWQSL